MAVECTRCTRPLVEHCPSPTCTWLRCTNHGCTARLFDVSRGLLQLKDHTVIGWADE